MTKPAEHLSPGSSLSAQSVGLAERAVHPRGSRGSVYRWFLEELAPADTRTVRFRVRYWPIVLQKSAAPRPIAKNGKY
jgi:hypothetical protein